MLTCLRERDEMTDNLILIVEDDPYQRRQMARFLRAEGYNVVLAPSGVEAVRILGETNISMVLTDRKMPLMDGVALVRHIRTHYPHLPVAMLTAYPEDVESSTVDALLCKPYRGQQLLDVVRSLGSRGIDAD